MASSKEKEQSQVEQRERVDEQCVLIDNLKELSLAAKRLEYSNFTMLEGEPGLIVHKMAGKKGIEELFGLTPAQISLLVPSISIHKIEYDENNKKGQDYKLVFNDHASKKTVGNITKTRLGRGDDVGLESFSYALDGKTLGEGGFASCTLKIFFQNVQSLVSSVPKQANFIDLVIPRFSITDKKDKKKKEAEASGEWEPENFRIKVLSGWAIPSDPKGILINSNLRKVLEKSKTPLFLTLKSHSFDFNEDGSLVMTVEYKGSMESSLLSDKSDLLYMSSKGLEAKKIEKQLGKKIDSAGSDDVEEMKVLQLKSEDKQDRYSRIIDSLRNRGRLFFILSDRENVENFTNEERNVLEALKEKKELTQKEIEIAAIAKKAVGRRQKGIGIFKIPSKDTSKTGIGNFSHDVIAPTNELKKDKFVGISYGNMRKQSHDEITELTDKVLHKLVAQRMKEFGRPTIKVNYFYFGDLIDTVLDIARSQTKKDFNNFEFLLGPIAFHDPRTKAYEIYNLADIPISLNLFLAWYTKNVIKVQADRYLLYKFIRDIIDQIIIPALGENCHVEKQKVDVRLNYFSVPGKGKNGEIPPFERGKRIDIDSIKMPENLNKPSSHFYHYMFLYVTGWDVNSLEGDRKKDFEKGIYHLMIGADRGLVKKIKFNKTNQEYVGQMRAVKESESVKKLQDRYNAVVTLVGNNLFHPGVYVYLDTNRMGMGRPNAENSIASLLGLGGYFSITKVEHITGKDDYETELQLNWISSGRKRGEKPKEPIKKGADVLQKVNKKIEAFKNQKKIDAGKEEYRYAMNRGR